MDLGWNHHKNRQPIRIEATQCFIGVVSIHCSSSPEWDGDRSTKARQATPGPALHWKSNHLGAGREEMDGMLFELNREGVEVLSVTG